MNGIAIFYVLMPSVASVEELLAKFSCYDDMQYRLHIFYDESKTASNNDILVLELEMPVSRAYTVRYELAGCKYVERPSAYE